MHHHIVGDDPPRPFLLGPQEHNRRGVLTRFAKREHGGEVGTVGPFALAVVETAFGAMAAVELLGMVVGKAEKSIGFLLLMGQDMEIGVPRYDRRQSVPEKFRGHP